MTTDIGSPRGAQRGPQQDPQQGPQRFYVHGDLHEERPGVYFCARCDAFAAPSHFGDPFHSRTLSAKLVQSMAGWLRKAAGPGDGFKRPESAENLFGPELTAATLIARHDEAKWAKLVVDRY